MAVASADSPDCLDNLSGLIERVTYFNEETGFAVLRVKAGVPLRNLGGDLVA